MSMERRFLIAFLLSALVFIGWFLFFPPPPPPEDFQKPAAPSEEIQVEESSAGPAKDAPPSETKLPDEEWKAFVDEYLANPPERARSVRIDALRYRADFTTRGALLENFILTDYKGDDGKPLELIYHGLESREALPFAVEILKNEKRTKEANNALYSAKLDEHKNENISLVLTYATADFFLVRKEFFLSKEGYVINAKIDVSENGERLPALIYFGPGFGSDEDKKHSQFYHIREFLLGYQIRENAWHIERTYKQSILKAVSKKEAGMLEGFFRKRIPYEPSGDASLRILNPSQWVGMGDNYFAMLAFSENVFREVYFKTHRLEKPVPDKKPVVREAVSVGVSADDVSQIAFVPKDAEVLNFIERGTSQLVDLGVFWWLALPLSWMLDFFYAYLKNYGVAIILVTILVKILFHPLTRKGMTSMRKMQKFQPKVAAIKEKYQKKKDAKERQKMNEEIMALYKAEGVNPFGGCFPLLLQIPILWAFYSLLSVSIKIRQAPFVLWIDDLSMPDPYYVTPVVMGATMYIQQRISQPTVTDTQQKMMRWMPVLFTWFFLNFPSGLVLYWLTNNVLTIIQEFFIRRASEDGDKPKKKPKKPSKNVSSS